MWVTDASGGSQSRSSSDGSVSERTGEERAVCGCHTFPTSTHTIFTAYREELEQVEVFKYLGWLIADDDANNQAMRSNLRKARGCWARVSRVQRAEKVSP